MNCHCGKPLHYSDPKVQQFVEAMVRRNGQYVRITMNGRTWLVQRHYIALHGLKGSDLPRLGFVEIHKDQGVGNGN